MNVNQDLKYRCTSFVQPDVAIVVTNDKAAFDQLMEVGGTLLCHPELFNQLLSENDSSQLVVIPYAVQIHRDILAQFRSIPKYNFESYETQLY